MTARILIVDDVATSALVLHTKLTHEYFQVCVARDGQSGLREAARWQPDLVLLDVLMPDMDGYETCRQLKADADTQHIPVVMVTALDAPAERLRALEAGADDFLTKPVEFDTLLARVRSLVRLKRLLDEWRARGETVRTLGLAAGGQRRFELADARALVIDDDDQMACGVQAALARETISVSVARTQAEAMRMVEATAFDLLLLSLSLRDEDPLRLVSDLRLADSTRETPMLLIAERSDRKRLLRGFEMGANDWVVRPIDQAELLVRARNQLRRKFYQDQLQSDVGQALEMALTDPLTSFYNQRYLMGHLAELLRPRPPLPVGVMMIDVDHFKHVNDCYGHQTGDRALCAIAEVLRARTRVHDSLARYGGEEFVVVMPGAGMADALQAAERLREAVADMAFVPDVGPAHALTVSIGVACCVAGEATAAELLQRADAAMYRAKRAGRNRVEACAAAWARQP